MSKPATTQISPDNQLKEYSHQTAPLLVRDTVNPAVKDVQLLLKRLGFYYGEADGIYGHSTYSSIITFQTSRNLTPNGVVNSRTWEALIDADRLASSVPINDISKYSPETAPFLDVGSQGSVVRDIQAFLKHQGYYTGAIDGVYGLTTKAAVQSFQQRYNSLSNDGIVGFSTWAAMIDVARNPFAIS